jgi:hypothetical protein
MIDGELCRVRAFNALAEVTDGRVSTVSRGEPYASIVIECDRPREVVTGLITHRDDFVHLWSAFNERGVRDDEEVIVVWSRRDLKKTARLVSMFMPKLCVMICPKGAFELMTDRNFKPELTGRERWEAQAPIAEWRPEVMA